MGPTKNYDWHKKAEKEMEKNKTPDEQIRKGNINVSLIDKLEDNKESPECLECCGEAWEGGHGGAGERGFLPL